MSRRVRLGLERLLDEDVALLRGRRVGLLCNPASVDAELRHAAELLAVLPGVTLAALFGPEHGVRGDAQDMVGVGAGRDARTGVVCYSLYGDSRASLSPTPEMLAGLDAVVCDLPDIGCRYYTFAWTVALIMRACAAAGVEVIVADRPNPLGGLEVEGPTVTDGFESFVGLYPVAVRHGLTIGELAGYVNQRFGIGCRLRVVPVEGWSRAQTYDATGLPWVLPSPNMPTLDTAFVYPGMCLLEGTNLSEGRGTTRPFEIFGAPFVDGYRLAAELAGEALPGVAFRPLCFRPTFHKFGGQLCDGIQLHLRDRAAFRPLRTGVAVLAALLRLWPEEVHWREQTYEFESRHPAIDYLAGGSRLRRQLQAGAALPAIVDGWGDDQAAFAAARSQYLLYGCG